MIAARNNHEDLVKFLLNNGAYFNNKDERGYSPLDWGNVC